jgi:hypothetical protein
LIEQNRLFPITVLINLTKKEKTVLLEKGITICQEILSNPTVLDDFGLTKQKTRKVLQEIEDICSGEI